MRVKFIFRNPTIELPNKDFATCSDAVKFWKRMASMNYDVSSTLSSIKLGNNNGVFHSVAIDYGFMVDLAKAGL